MKLIKFVLFIVIVITSISTFAESIYLEDIRNESINDGTRGYVIEGERQGGELGYSVSDIGDVNVDGVDDFIFCGYRGNKCYLKYGGGAHSTKKLHDVNIEAYKDYDCGTKVSGGKDVNGDGISDFAITCWGGFDKSPFVAVFFGKENGPWHKIDPEGNTYLHPENLGFGDGSTGFLILSREGEVESGSGYLDPGAYRILHNGASLVDDITGDGIDDIVVGTENRGVIIKGKDYTQGDTFPNSIGVWDMDPQNGDNHAFGSIFIWTDQNETYVYDTGELGDINHDGITDIFFVSEDQVYILFGSQQGYSDIINEQDIIDGIQDGIIIRGENGFGGDVSAIGDFDSDGVDDFYISSAYRGIDGHFGYIFFGKKEGASVPFLVEYDLSNDEGNSSDYIKLLTGRSYSSSGGRDLNNDGISDFIIPIWRESAAYVIFGVTNRSALKTGARLEDLNRQSGTMKVYGHYDGISSANADIDENNDGYNDILIGSPFSSPTEILGGAGRGFVIYGPFTPNELPVANDDEYTIDNTEDIELDIFSNDQDSDGQIIPSSVEVLVSPAYGNVYLNESQDKIIYAPYGRDNSGDTFKYRVQDSSEAFTNEATVNIKVSSSEDPEPEPEPEPDSDSGSGGGSVPIFLMSILIFFGYMRKYR